MFLELIQSRKAALIVNQKQNDLSADQHLNYSKSTYDRSNNVTLINIDRAVKGKGDFANVKTYTQNSIKKHELTGNKEICIRKILISKREDSLFDITVRELNIYYRNSKKQDFSKVLRFKSIYGNIEYIFELLKNSTARKQVAMETSYLLN